MLMWICNTSLSAPPWQERENQGTREMLRLRHACPSICSRVSGGARRHRIGSGRDADARPQTIDRLAGGRPKIPLRAEQVEVHALTTCPGMPEFLRVESA